MTDDVRKSKRAPVSLKVRFKSATVDEFIEQYSADISKGGIFIKSEEPLPPGTLLKFEFQLQDNSPLILGVGRVVWKRDTDEAKETSLPSGMGIKFIKMDERSRAVVERIVAGKEKVKGVDEDAPPQGMPESKTKDSPAPKKDTALKKTADEQVDDQEKSAPEAVSDVKPSKPQDIRSTVPGTMALHDALAKAMSKTQPKSQTGQPAKQPAPVAKEEMQKKPAEKPAAEKPVEKKAEEKPVVKPVEKPVAEKPVEKPVEKPAVEKPVEKKVEEKPVEQKEVTGKKKKTKKGKKKAAAAAAAAAAAKVEKKKSAEAQAPPKKLEEERTPSAPPPSRKSRPAKEHAVEEKSSLAWVWVILVAAILAVGVYFMTQDREGFPGHEEDQAMLTSNIEEPITSDATHVDADVALARDADVTEEVVQFRIVSNPSGATVLVGEEQQEGVTPLDLSGLMTGSEVTIQAQLAGYQPASKQLAVTNETQEVAFEMVPLERRVILKSAVRTRFFVDDEMITFSKTHTFDQVELPFKVKLTATSYEPLELTIDENSTPWDEIDGKLVHEPELIELVRVTRSPTPRKVRSTFTDAETPSQPAPPRQPPPAITPAKTSGSLLKQVATPPTPAPAQATTPTPAKTSPPPPPASTVSDNPY